MSVGENIKRVRKEKGITQKELGIKLGGISQQQIGQWETGKANPKIETINKIAFALGVSRDALISNTSPKEQGTILKAGLLEMIKNVNFEATIEDNTDINTLTIEILEKRIKYNQFYDLLNVNGQNKAIEQVEMLTKIPEYMKTSEFAIEEEKKNTIYKRTEED